MRIHTAEMFEPMATSQMVARCSFGPSRSQPKIHRPRKVDSRKKATSASMASGAPKTSPTKRLYSDQFMPNWNSCTMPVTTPMAKLINSRVPKSLVSRFQVSPPPKVQMVCISATAMDSPMVNGTKKKW